MAGRHVSAAKRMRLLRVLGVVGCFLRMDDAISLRGLWAPDLLLPPSSSPELRLHSLVDSMLAKCFDLSRSGVKAR